MVKCQQFTTLVERMAKSKLRFWNCVCSFFYLFIYLYLFVYLYMCLLFSGCYPYYDKDPFILEKCPHVYFVGNQPKYQSKVLQGKIPHLSGSLRKQPSHEVTTWALAKRDLSNECRNSVLMMCHYPDLGNASDWLEFSQKAQVTTLWNICHFLRLLSSCEQIISRYQQIGCLGCKMRSVKWSIRIELSGSLGIWK